MHNLTPLPALLGAIKYKKLVVFLTGFLLSLSVCAIEPVAAVRLLQQSTFGPTPTEINRLNTMSEEEWIDEQLSTPMTLHRHFHNPASGYPRANHRRVQEWFRMALHGEDQLRQRMAFALSQIFVVSEIGPRLKPFQSGLINYYDTLIEGALGNYRDLMYKVTMHPVMGTYLTYSPNYKAADNGSNEADENYARELLQLMSVGIYLLNQDGTYQLDSNGKPIETYSPAQIKGFAKVFTGLCYTGRCDARFGIYDTPMIADYSAHDKSEKVLLSTTLAANSGSVEADINAALDDIFAHQNIAPFISQRLIQMLVTSNPTPAYVSRVAGVFNDNGYGVKGDLAAVAKAILLDDEARNGHQGENALVFGKLREPLLMLTHYFRALEVFPEGDTPWNGFRDLENHLFQAPMMATSVFNFYHFDHTNPSLLQGMANNALVPINDPHSINGRAISLESANYPNHYVQYINGEVRISPVAQEEQAKQWKIVKGLAGENTFSIESVNFPGHFLRHAFGQMLLDPEEDTQFYKSDASWHWQNGLSDSNAVSFESLNFPNEFIRHSNYLLIRTVADTTLDKNDASFFIKAAKVNTEKLVFPEFELSPQDKLLYRLGFIYNHVIRRGEAFPAYDKIVGIIDAAPSREIGVENLVDHIDLMFTQGEMSDELREQVLYIIEQTRRRRINRNGTFNNGFTDSVAMRDVMMLLFTSADFAIQR